MTGSYRTNEARFANRRSRSTCRVWAMWHVIRALSTRYESLMQTSLAVELVDGFPHHSMQSIFGEKYASYKRWDEATRAESPFQGLARQSYPSALEGKFIYVVFSFYCYVLYTVTDPSEKLQHLNDCVNAMYQLVAADPVDPQGAAVWLRNLLIQHDIEDVVAQAEES